MTTSAHIKEKSGMGLCGYINMHDTQESGWAYGFGGDDRINSELSSTARRVELYQWPNMKGDKV